jgi:hypothetical protein
MPAIFRALCCSSALLLLLTACQGGASDGTVAAGTVAWEMKCVNRVMGTNAKAPVVVVLTNRSFHQRFGSQYDGWYDGTDDMVYLSSHHDGSLLPHELAHHVQHRNGRYLNEAQAREVARLCS